jgi:twitching motility protein PilT
MDFDSLIALAQNNGASDLHLEGGLPPALRIRGALRTAGEPLPSKDLLNMARSLLGEEAWPEFLQRRSADFSRTIHGVRCRINVLHSARGVGFAVRLLSTFQASIDKLNLHPDLKKIMTAHSGLILVSGATGSGKSSTMAALIEEVNAAETRHILTIESPIEYMFRPRKAYIRQREVGRDTPSFEQALIDSLREDPDVLMVGEMRDPETMRLTLSASETGHLVLATVHSSSCAEALQRVVSAFPAEIQSGVSAQLADCLVAVICQRLLFRQDQGIRVPECEILMANHAVKNFIRNRDFFKIVSSLETGAEHGMWSFTRYRKWLESKKTWSKPGQSAEPTETEPEETPVSSAPMSMRLPSVIRPPQSSPPPQETHRAAEPPQTGGPTRIDIEPVEGEFGKILKHPGST